jgi:hypothetical protein
MPAYRLLLFFSGAFIFSFTLFGSVGWTRQNRTPVHRFTRTRSFYACLASLVSSFAFILSFRFVQCGYFWLSYGLLLFANSIIRLISIPIIYWTNVPAAYNNPSNLMKQYFVGYSLLRSLFAVFLLLAWTYCWRYVFIR